MSINKNLQLYVLHFCPYKQNEATEPHCVDKFEFSRKIFIFLGVDVFSLIYLSQELSKCRLWQPTCHIAASNSVTSRGPYCVHFVEFSPPCL